MSTNRTSKQKKKVRVPLDENLLDLALLQDEIAVESAIGVLEVHLENTAVDRDTLLRDLMARRGLFEFVFSELSGRGASIVKEHIISVFPSNARAFGDSLASALLSQLSQYFWHMGYPEEALEEQHRLVQTAGPVLKALSKLYLPSDAKITDADAVEGELEGLPLLKKSANQRDRKKNKRAATQAPSIDTKLFAKLNVEPPSSAQDANEIERQVLGDQQDILMHYLDVLRKPSLAAIFKSAYITRPVESTPNLVENETTNNAGEISSHVDIDTVQSPVFSNIQPTKAALYFDSVDGFGDWHIQISTRADKDLREARRADQKRFKIYLKKIMELSNGHFSDDNAKRLTGANNDIPIYEAKMTRDTRLVYQIDCVKEYEEETERQIIKVFGIYTHAQLERGDFWTSVSKHLSGKGKEYKRRCLYRTKPTNGHDNVYAPATFPLSSEKAIAGTTTNLAYLQAADKQDLHSLLVLEKFVIFSQALLNTILANEDAAHVFHMSPTEQAIVRHIGSCYVLGRSGTGKTTTMLFKMLGIEQAYDHRRVPHSGETSRPRQLFVTQSQVLADKVREYYMKLATSQAAARRTAEESKKLAAEQKQQVEQGLFDKDEEEFHHGTLPKSFAELDDSHFPLFITYDHLCRLLEGPGAPATSATQNGNGTAAKPTIATGYMLQRRASFVSYDRFLSEYWPHLPQYLTKAFDPALIFAEFMSIIKGSEESVLSEKGFVDLETYMNVTRRQQGTFTRNRDLVYTLFLEYAKMKQDREEWDAADRTNSILRDLRSHGVPGNKVDFVYVDEVQDNLMIDALLMRTLCKNPSFGLFWAGDTAQTISAGSSFRFEALKSLMYRVEQSLNISAPTKTPQEFQLIANYRSHGGIVNAAHSIVKLLTRFWPQTIDTLAEERAEVDGAKPIFFTGWDQDTVQYEQFLFGASGSQIEFGANQCILVRDDAARDELRKQVGDIGTVLTLYESKGLEFNDVLLYNFFEDSTVDVGQWRVILNALPELGRESLRCPAFDENRHSGVCRELKFLYVAITRARQNLWIADCSDKGEPLRLFWSAQGLVSNVSAVGTVPHLAISSRPDEWAAMARTLFDNKRYSQASRAFDRANMPRARDIADAYHRREMARRVPINSNSIVNHRGQAFLEAAQAFSLCADATHLPTERLAYSRNAAECFLEASEMKMAAEAYIRAEEHTKAAHVFRQGGLFDEAVDTIEQYVEQIEPADAEKIRDVARIHYSIEQNLDRATKLFGDVDEALDFMEGFGFDVARVNLLEQYGRIQEAAEIHLAEGRTLEAIRLLLSGQQEGNQELHSCLERYFSQGIWENLSFGVSLEAATSRSRSQLQELLLLSKEAVVHSMYSATSRTVDEFALVRAILDHNTPQLRVLADRFIRAHTDPGTGALCLDVALRDWAQLEKATTNIMLETVQAFSTYINELLQMSSDMNPAENVVLQRIFGFYPTPETEHLATVPAGTMLHAYIVKPDTRWVRTVSTDNDGCVLNPWELSRVFQDMLRDQLLQRTRGENFACLQAPSLRMCPAYVMFGERDSKHRCSSSHDPQGMNMGALRSRFRLLLQQIITYQFASVFEMRIEKAKQRRRWISRLYEAYFPVYGKAGSAIDVDLTTIPEAEKGFQVIREWIRDLLLEQRFEMMGPWPFLTFIVELVTLTWRLEKQNTVQLLRRAPCITIDRHVDFIRNGHRYIVWDLLDFLSLSSTTSLSAGVLFIKSVCDKHLPIDANVLCHIVELLCAAYVIGRRLRIRASLHDITMSRRLLARLCTNEKLKEQDSHMLKLLVTLMCTLLREMYTGTSEFLLYDRSSRIDTQVRNIFVMRICKSLTLLGYNINDPLLHSLILQQFTSFRSLNTRPDARYSGIFQRYVEATSWADLVRAVRNTGSYEKNTPEELVHLKEASRLRDSPYDVFGTRSIVYKTIGDIPSLLRGDTPLRPTTAARDTSIPPPSSSGHRGIDSDRLKQQTERDAVEDGVEMPVSADVEDAGIAEPDITAGGTDTNQDQHTVVPPTTHEIQAVTFLARLYRTKLIRKQSAAEKGVVAETNRLYQTFQESPHLETMPTRYRLLFLGPLPLVILCLRTMATHIANAKAQIRTRMALAPHSDYERIGAQMVQTNAIDRQVQLLKKLLDPKSEFHRLVSEEELRVHVQQVASIASEHPRAIEGMEMELKMAVKGIVQKPAPRKVKPTSPKAKKPELVVDLEDDYDIDLDI